MSKDRIVELNLVVRLDRHLDDDLELLIRDYLQSEGLLEVTELTRVGMTGTIDLPRVWLPGQPDIYDATLDPLLQSLPPAPVPVAKRKPPPPPPPERWKPPWRKK